MFSFLYGFIRGAFTAMVVIVALIAIVLALISDAEAGDLRCKESIWGGTTTCRERGDDSRIVIKKNRLWDEDEIRRDGKLVARCKRTIWGEILCQEEE
jgi:hypothetical protein